MESLILNDENSKKVSENNTSGDTEEKNNNSESNETLKNENTLRNLADATKLLVQQTKSKINEIVAMKEKFDAEEKVLQKQIEDILKRENAADKDEKAITDIITETQILDKNDTKNTDKHKTQTIEDMLKRENTDTGEKVIKNVTSETRILDKNYTKNTEKYKTQVNNNDETDENDTEKTETESDFDSEDGVIRKKDKKRKITNLLKDSFRRNKNNLRASFQMKRSISEPNNSDSSTSKDLPKRTRSLRMFKATLLYLPIMKTMQPPAPLLVEDPPSSDDGNDLEKVKNSVDPALLNGSSGNFGSAGAKSAPPTPQGLLCTSPTGPAGVGETLSQPNSPGCTSPSIQRSPSHTVFTKCDKSSLKHLSTSTPVMTAQAHLSEPPSPKAAKDPKVHTTSKARQKKFLRHFPNVDDDEKVLNHYSCALIGDILLQGHLYITKNYFAFYSNVFGYVTKLLIPILTVEDITKEKTARIIPNAVGIVTGDDKHVFGSLMSRDSTLQYMRTVWQKAKSEEIIPEPEIIEQDQDSSESAESGRDSPGPEMIAPPTFSLVRKLDQDGKVSQNEGIHLERKGSQGFVKTLKQAISEFRKLPRQSLILVATTLLLILLFLSAAVLLYRINKIQNRYSLALNDNIMVAGSDDVYTDLLQWQTQLHSKSAGAVHSFLDTNLDQIAKVRQSLEALSTLLINNNNINNKNEVTRTDEHSESTKDTVRNS